MKEGEDGDDDEEEDEGLDGMVDQGERVDKAQEREKLAYGKFLPASWHEIADDL